MAITYNRFLIAGAVMSAAAALAHLGCIVFGAPWYRFFGAGEQMARMALRGHWYPTVVTLAIASVLLVWSLYAFSGAGVIRRLPLVRAVLSAITGVYQLRGVASPCSPTSPAGVRPSGCGAQVFVLPLAWCILWV